MDSVGDPDRQGPSLKREGTRVRLDQSYKDAKRPAYSAGPIKHP